MTHKPRLLILSAVLPFPRNSGQQQRVYYTLLALRTDFHLTFLTVAPRNQREDIRRKLLELCDEAIVLPSLYHQNFLRRLFYKVAGILYSLFSGLKTSNYSIGEVEFSPARLRPILATISVDAVLFEYWHAYKVTQVCREHGLPTILDMHDILWRSYASQLESKKYLPEWLRRKRLSQYRICEEAAWKAFNILITINRDEHDYARQVLGEKACLFYVPMGIDLSAWPYEWDPAQPVRIGYYGGLGSQANHQEALHCYHEIMPKVWQKYPAAEYWIVGSNPPKSLQDLARDKRVKVTGFLERPQEILKTMQLILCPRKGKYGFRSRIVEVMALGVPVIVSSDAIAGMEFQIGEGIMIGEGSAAMVAICLDLLRDPVQLRQQSLMARQQIEERFGFEATYETFSRNLASTLMDRDPTRAVLRERTHG